MDSNYQIRLIEATDNARVAEIIRTVMTEFDCVGDGYSINDAEVDAMYENYTTEKARFYVLTSQDTLLGCAGFAPLQHGASDTCELRKMYFLPEGRGLGMGRKMIEICMNDAKAIGFQKMYLETVERMTSANILYEKMGFKKLCGAVGDTGHCSCDSFYRRTL